eukprot:6189864-Pleurochrysis_carterae.AAC.1
MKQCQLQKGTTKKAKSIQAEGSRAAKSKGRLHPTTIGRLRRNSQGDRARADEQESQVESYRGHSRSEKRHSGPQKRGMSRID